MICSIWQDVIFLKHFASFTGITVVEINNNLQMCSSSWIFTVSAKRFQSRLIRWILLRKILIQILRRSTERNSTQIQLPDAASAFAVPINPPPLYKPHRYLALEISEQVEFLEQT